MLYSIKRTPLAAAMLLALNTPLYSTQVNAVVLGPGDAVGVEFKVNTETSNHQNNPSVAMDADGDFVVAWTSNVQDGSGYGVYAQRYNADGSPAGDEFKVNTETSGDQHNPSVAMDADGDFVVSWQSRYQDGSGDGVYAQRYLADGTAAGGEFKVNTETSSNQSNPSVAMDADGDFVVSWQSLYQDGSGDGVYAQRYLANGTAAGGEFKVNTETSNSQSNPSVAMDADGDFVVSWQSRYQDDGNGWGVFAQRFSAAGAKVGGEISVNSYVTDHQTNPRVAMDADGDFVVSWESSYQDTSELGVYAQRFNATGDKVGNEIPVNTYVNNYQRSNVVAMDADGDFVVSWQSLDQDLSQYGVYAQRYNANGMPDGPEFLVNTNTNIDQKNPGVAMDADGDFVVAWVSVGQDGNGEGVYAQRFIGAGETVDLNLVVTDNTDPVSIGNNFVYSLITTNNGSGIAMDVNLSTDLPTGLVYVSDDAALSGWTCTELATTLNCNKPFMTAAAVDTIDITVNATAAGTLSNTVTATAAQTDVNTADNTDTETTEVKAAPVSSSSGALGVLSLLLAVPLWLRRRFK